MVIIGRISQLSRRCLPRPEATFFSMLERYGLTYAELEKAVGAEAVPRAIGRCTDCGARYHCGWRRAGCLNGPLFAAAVRRKSLPAA